MRDNFLASVEQSNYLTVIKIARPIKACIYIDDKYVYDECSLYMPRVICWLVNILISLIVIIR